MSKVTVIAVLNPITHKRVACEIPAKGRLRDYFAIPDGNIIYRNGEPYENGELFPNDLINIIVPPKGGEQGKDIARTGLILGLQIAAGVLTGGLSTALSAVIVGGVSVAGALAVNALIPPPNIDAANVSQEGFTRLGALTGTRNQINPYGVVPRVYGHRKMYPPMSAKPYTEIGGDKQFLRVLFNLGAGPLELSSPKIGDTVIGSFDSNNVFTSNDAYQNVEIDVAEQPELYSTQVNQTDPGVNLDEDGESALRTTELDTEEISLDVTFPQGLFAIDENGRTLQHRVDFRVEYSPTGAETWTNAIDATAGRSQGGFIRLTTPELFRALSSKKETWRGNLSWKVLPGQYDVRITRVETADYEPVTKEDYADDGRVTNTFDAASWTAFRSIAHEEPTDLPGTVQIGMRIQATDQINGILDNFSVEVKSRLAYYTGAAWDEPTFDASTGNGTGGIVTSSPAWILADVLTGSQNARPRELTDLDADGFKDFADNCTTEGRECNIILDQPRTVHQTAALVGSTGRGSLAIHDGVYKVIQDIDGQTPVQHFTPRNSWDFSSMRTFPKVPHAIRVNFIDPDAGWEVNEAVVYDDGYSLDGTNCLFDDGTGVCKVATNFETLDLSDTVTDYDQAWKEGRYRMAEARLRPERYIMMTDVENIVCQRGDDVLVSHDVTLWGGQSGRIKSISGDVLTLDEEVIIEAGKSYNIRVRNQSGLSIVKTVSTGTGTHTEITVNNVTDIATGDLFMFGEVDSETQLLKVFSIEPQGDLSARITFVDAAPEIYDADQEAIPDFNSNITSPAVDPATTPPPPPIITNVRSDGDSLYQDADGDPKLRVIISYTIGGGAPTEFIEGRFRRLDDEDGWSGFGQVAASTGSISLSNADRGGVYIFQLRARRGELTSDWVQSESHTAGQNIKLKGRPENAIGYITEDLEGSYTEIPVYLTHAARDGIDYNIVAEIDRVLIPITPTETAPSGSDIIKLDEANPTYIEAQEGSYIVEAAGQKEAETTEQEERVRVLDEVKIPKLEGLIENIQIEAINDSINTAIEEAVDGLNFYTQNDIDTITQSLTDAINDRVGLGLSYNRVSISEENGLLVTGLDGGSVVGRINLRGSGTTSEGQSFAGIHIQKYLGSDVWETNFFADLDGNLYLTGTLQPGSILVGDATEGVVIHETLGVLVQGTNARVLLNASGADDEATSFAGLSIQQLDGGNWVSNLHADASGNIFAKGNFELVDGSVLVGSTSEGVFIDDTLGLLVKGANARVILNATDPGTEDVSFAGINIQEWNGSSWVSNFYATPSGDVFLRGEINAESGSIGDLTLDSNGITNAAGDFTLDGSGYSVAVSTGLTVSKSYALDEGNKGALYCESSGAFLDSVSGNDLSVRARGTNADLGLSADGDIDIVTTNTVTVTGSTIVLDGFTQLNDPIGLPNYTETQRDNISSPQAGWVVYNTTTSRPNYHDGTNWVNF